MLKNNKLENLKSKYPIIEKLKEERVVDFGSDYEKGFDGSCWIGEACDDWYDYDLSKNDCIELSNFFIELSDMLINQEEVDNEDN